MIVQCVEWTLTAKTPGSEIGKFLQAERAIKMGPLMLGLFTNEKHLNFGKYEGYISQQAVRQRFFGILGTQLGVSSQPKLIGNLAQAYGHAETGLPAMKKNSGCALVILLCIGIIGIVFVIW